MGSLILTKRFTSRLDIVALSFPPVRPGEGFGEAIKQTHRQAVRPKQGNMHDLRTPANDKERCPLLCSVSPATTCCPVIHGLPGSYNIRVNYFSLGLKHGYTMHYLVSEKAKENQAKAEAEAPLHKGLHRLPCVGLLHHFRGIAHVV